MKEGILFPHQKLLSNIFHINFLKITLNLKLYQKFFYLRITQTKIFQLTLKFTSIIAKLKLTVWFG